MGSQYITRLGTQATQGAFATLATLAGSTVNDQTVPQGVSSIRAVITAITNTIQTVADAGGTVIVRLVGNGIVDGGQQDITVGSYKGGTSSTGHTINTAIYIPTDISVKPGNTITVQASQDGVDIGTLGISVTLVYQ